MSNLNRSVFGQMVNQIANHVLALFVLLDEFLGCNADQVLALFMLFEKLVVVEFRLVLEELGHVCELGLDQSAEPAIHQSAQNADHDTARDDDEHKDDAEDSGALVTP